MKAAKIQITNWDKACLYDVNGFDLEKGDMVIVKNDLGNELGEVLGLEDVDVENFKTEEGKEPKVVLRMATAADLEKVPDDEKRNAALAECKALVEKYGLEMKLVDVHFSYDGSKLTIGFIADGRVDFRELAKELTRKFNRTIRLQQIGIRDEAKICGDCGHCGKPLCCKKFLKEFVSITSEMAEIQQCEHRGSDRISGVCGRLMCCLAYEEKGYKDLVKDMPAIGAMVNVDGKRGEVIGHHYLKRSVDVKFPDPDGRNGYTIIEVDLDRNKKKGV